MKIQISSLEDLDKAAKEFLLAIKDTKIIAFYGEMGAGKTTFIKALCKHLGVTDVINSPTFSIVNEYTDRDNKPIYHFDFYRIKQLEEAYDFGYEDYFYSHHLCFIEWPQLIEPLLPENCLKLSILEKEDGTRELSFEEK